MQDRGSPRRAAGRLRSSDGSDPPREGPEPAVSGTWLEPFAWRHVALIASLATALLLAFASRNGYHRDELYFIEASRHLAWGYVDQPPGSIVMIGLSRTLLGDSLLALRVFPAFAFFATIVTTGLIAREMGGRRLAQVFAALTAVFTFFLAAGHIATTAAYDVLAWTIVSLLVLRILRTGRVRLWLWVGLAVGVALLFKETILLLVVALIIGLLSNGQSRVLWNRWVLVAALIAMAIWSPVILWQARHGWATVEMSGNLRSEHSGLQVSLGFPVVQLLLAGVWSASIWLAGLWALLRDPGFRAYRSFAFAYVVLFVAIGLFMGDRPYYLGPLYAVLLSAGAIVTAEVVAGRRRFFSARPPRRRRLIWRSPLAAVVFVVVCAVVALPLALPVLPPRLLARVPLQRVNDVLVEEVGWPELVTTVAHVYRSLPPAERRTTVILTDNYGQAGAIDRFGPAEGLPRAYSGHNSYWWWGPPSPALGTAIVVGFGSDAAPYLSRYFRSVTRAATVHNRYGVENQEQGCVVWLCRGQIRPWPQVWRQFRVYH